MTTTNADELRQTIERWERLESEKKELSEIQRYAMDELKVRGYDTAAVKAIIKARAADPDKLSDLEASIDLYKSALGMN